MPETIPDGGSIDSTVPVPGGGPISDVEITLSIAHPFDSDVQIELVSPTGKRVSLAEGVGTWGNDFSDTTFAQNAETSIVSALPPFSGRFRPAESLATFTGSDAGGTWKLKVSDLRERYEGQLDTWQLSLTTCDKVSVPKTKAGAPTPPPLPDAVPAGQEPIEGTLITVTTNSGVTNGDVSTVEALEANPGSDGISLSEAIEATNNDTGTYTVRFDTSLIGAEIILTNDLPILRGGGVFIDGDIDGNGRPDVTLVSVADPGTVWGWGLNVASSGNRVHALAMRGFEYGVLFTAMRSGARGPLLKDQTFEQNVVTGLELNDVGQSGIWIFPAFSDEDCARGACPTSNRWLDTRMVGNTVTSRNGIRVDLEAVAGDEVRRLTIVGNDLRIAKGTKAVSLTVGGGAGSNQNRASDALVAYNSISIRGSASPINVVAGWAGARNNVVEDIRIVSNTVHFSGSGHPDGLFIVISDGCAGQAGAQQGTGICSRGNVARRIGIVGNRLEGVRYSGVQVADLCCNTQADTRIEDVLISENVIEQLISKPTQFQNPWGVAIGGLTGDGSAGMSNVTIDSNTIIQKVTESTGSSARYLTGGGIVVAGGLGKPHTSVKDLAINNNRIDTKLMGIVLMGGGPSGEKSGQDNAIGNRVSRVELRGNMILLVPSLARQFDARLKGISLIGGLGGAARPDAGWRARNNSVQCVNAKRNSVAGKRNDIAVLPNVGAGASNNVARLGGC